MDNVVKYKKFVIVGDSKCGKTTLLLKYLKSENSSVSQQYSVNQDLKGITYEPTVNDQYLADQNRSSICEQYSLGQDLKEMADEPTVSDQYSVVQELGNTTVKPTVYDQYTVDLSLEGNTVYKLSIHDTAGRYVYDRFRYLSYGSADCILVCFSVDSQESLHNACDKWIPEIRHLCQNTPYILVGSKTDLRKDKFTTEKLRKRRESFVQREEGIAASHSMKAQLYVECSSKNNSNIDDVFLKALQVSEVKSKKFPSVFQQFWMNHYRGLFT